MSEATRFSTQKQAIAWLSDNFGMYWEEAGVEGRYGACVPPKDLKEEPVYSYADTVVETISKLADAVEA